MTPDPPSLKKRGRPALDARDASVSLHVRITTTAYASLTKRATAAGVTVPEVVRWMLRPDPERE